MMHQGLQKRKETIVDNIVSQIDEDDVIITFGESKRITEAFVKAAEQFNPSQDEDFVAPFRVIVIGGRPKKNNENMLRRLVEKKVSCSIAPINALPFVMEVGCCWLDLGVVGYEGVCVCCCYASEWLCPC